MAHPVTRPATLPPPANEGAATSVGMWLAGGNQDPFGNNRACDTCAVAEVDTLAPTVSSITLSDSALKMGDAAVVTIVFSEAIELLTLTLSDLSYTNDTLSALATAAKITWTDTLAPTVNVEAASDGV